MNPEPAYTMPGQFYYISTENTRVGPIPWVVLEQLNQSGTVVDETLTASEGASGWMSFHDLKVQHEGLVALPPVPQSQPQSAAFDQPRIVEEGARRLKQLIDKSYAIVKNNLHLVGIAFGTTFIIMLLGYAGVSLVQGNIPSFSWGNDNTTAEEGPGGLDLRSFSKRPEVEQEYIIKLQDVYGSLVSVQRTWSDVEKLSTFPNGEYWRGMPAGRAIAESRRLTRSLDNLETQIQALATCHNELQRAAEPFLSNRPDLKETHDSFKLATRMKFVIGNPETGYHFESMERGMEKMYGELDIAWPGN